MAINIVWFKRDLRLEDHAPLYEAAKNGSVVPLYIIEPDLWRLADSSRRHWHFIHDSLYDLKKALIDYGVTLIIRIGEVEQVFNEIRDEIGTFTLWSHEETGNDWTFKRDVRVAEWCRSKTIIWHEKPTNGVVRRLKSRDGWSKIRDQRMSLPPLKLEKLIPLTKNLNSHDLLNKNHALFGSKEIGSVQTGGRQSGENVLRSFLKERSRNYLQTISKPGISARHCSRLSPHITFGTFSMREIEQATKAKINLLSLNNDQDAHFHKRNLTAFISRLAWQSHFIQKLEQQPDIEFKCMHQSFEGMREPHFREDYFESWKKGQTGYPLIDAAMRSLQINGWITFRMRAMLVSFASYHLWLDWRMTAPFMAQLFTDYEPGIHYSQFQMQSGVTGINAIRIYNPIKQSYDNDSKGTFIRRYLPELHNVPDSFIHEPWRFPIPPKEYPSPIVEHETAMKFARNEISLRRKNDGFRQSAKAVNTKLGSRKKNEMAKTKKPTQQLQFDL